MAYPKDDPKNIFGWCMYDWANSAYVTTVYVGVLPAYFASVVVGSEGLRIGGIETSASVVWAFVVALSSFIAFLSAPVLGAVSDGSSGIYWCERFLRFVHHGSRKSRKDGLDFREGLFVRIRGRRASVRLRVGPRCRARFRRHLRRDGRPNCNSDSRSVVGGIHAIHRQVSTGKRSCRQLARQ